MFQVSVAISLDPNTVSPAVLYTVQSTITKPRPNPNLPGSLNNYQDGQPKLPPLQSNNHLTTYI